MPADHFVLDASVIVKWIRTDGEDNIAEADRLRDRIGRSEVVASVPRLMYLELINVAARRWGWGEGLLLEMLDLLDEMPLTVDDADSGSVAAWAATGLTAYDASYVALADELNCFLVTADTRIPELAPDIALPLSSYPAA